MEEGKLREYIDRELRKLAKKSADVDVDAFSDYIAGIMIDDDFGLDDKLESVEGFLECAVVRCGESLFDCSGLVVCCCHYMGWL
jgi:hypothetical protein